MINLGNDPGPYTEANASTGIQFYGAFGGTLGTFSNVEITGNTITNVVDYRRAIALTNGSAAPGTNGEIINAVVSCNQISGPGAPGSIGIRLSGLVSSPTIVNNEIDGVDTAVQAREGTGGQVATGIALNENSFTNIGTFAIDWWGTTPFDATNNWYGAASGPTVATNPSGTGAAIGASGGPAGAGVVDYEPWLTTGADAEPGTCFIPDDPSACIGGGVFETKPKSRVVLTKINTDATPGNDGLTISASFTLPVGKTFAEVQPDLQGARIVLLAQDGTPRLDVTIPPGAYDKATKVGWKRSGNGKAIRFNDRSGAAAGGIHQVVINDKNSPKTPRRVKVLVKGKKSTYAVTGADVPVQAIVTLGDETAAAAGLCGESAYAPADCRFNPKGNRLTCRR